MLNFIESASAQVLSRVYHRLGGNRDFFAAASDMVELCAPEVIEGRPIKMLDGQLDRITASPFNTPFQNEILTARGSDRIVGPTNMYVFKNVIMAKRRIISANRHEQFCWPQSEWAFSEPEIISDAALADSIQGTRFFGHWLSDDCATNSILPTEMPLVRPKRVRWVDEDLYSDLLDLRSARSITHAIIREMVYVDDVANNSHKLQRIRDHRRTIRSKISRSGANDVVYIARGRSGRGRIIDNEADVIDALRSYGAKIVVAEEFDSLMFLREILDSNLIISAEGSQCAHALYALRDCAAGLITLQPHNRFFLTHLEWVRLLELDFGIVVSNPELGEFWVDPNEVMKTIDLF